MARTHEDIEHYVMASNIPNEQVAAGTWLLRDPDWGGAQIIVHHTDPLLIYRVKLFDVPASLTVDQQAKLYRHLLELNATEMLQGAYAIEGDSVVAVEVMQVENLDQNEFMAAVDSLTLAIIEHRRELTELIGGQPDSAAAA